MGFDVQLEYRGGAGGCTIRTAFFIYESYNPVRRPFLYEKRTRTNTALEALRVSLRCLGKLCASSRL